MSSLPRIASIAFLFLFFAGLAVSQGSAVTCSAISSPAPVIRTDGEAEVNGDLVVKCTGGVPTLVDRPLPPVNIAIFLNEAVTSRLLAPGFSEALLLIDEPPAASQLACANTNNVCTIIANGTGVGEYDGTQGRPNVFQGIPGSGNNSIQWNNIPFDPPGQNIRTLRFVNIRGNALGGPASVIMSFSISGQVPVFVNVSQQPVASAQSGLGFSAKNVLGGAGGLTQFTLSYAERFGAAFKTRTAAAFIDANTSPTPANQNSLGSPYPGSETGFFNSGFPSISGRGNLGAAGLADSGTRLIARIGNIPAGVSLAAPLTANLVQSNNTVTGLVRLVNTDVNGAGPFSPSGTTQIPIVNGIATMVYEVLKADPNTLESVDIPITVSYGANAAAFPTATVTGALAALSTVGTADLTAPDPRFNNQIQLTVTAPVSSFAITTTSLPPATAGSSYSFSLTASGGATPYSWSAGGLPPGINLSGNLLNGVPTANSPGTYTVTVIATDANQTQANARFVLTVNAALSITNSSLPPGMVGAKYSQVFTASGGTPPYTFSLAPSSPIAPNSLPPGLGINPNGTLSGTPLTAGNYSFTILVTDSAQNQQRSTFSLNVTPPLMITTLSPVPPGAAASSYSQTFSASGGTAPYGFSIAGPGVPGLAMSAAGVLSGTPTAIGTFNFTVQVTDNLQFVATRAFQITIAAAPPALRVSPVTLAFAAVTGGDAPPTQAITIIPSGTTPVAFQVDRGTAPAWLTIRPLIGTAPARLSVSVDPGGLPAGSYSAIIRVLVPRDNTQVPTDVSVVLTISPGTPQLEIVPRFLKFAARVQAPGTLEQAIFVRNSGGGTALNLTASVVGQTSWIASVTPAAGQTAPNSPVALRVRVNTQGLDVGSYHGIIRVVSTAGSSDVPVSLFVSDRGAILGLNVTGLRFQARQGTGASIPQVVNVLNLGDPGSSVNWSADLLSGDDWLSIVAPMGTAATNQPGVLPLKPTPNAAAFPPGGRYALVRVSDPQALNSPQYLVAVLDVAPANSPALPDPSPAGLFFSIVQGTQASLQPLLIYTSSNSAEPFEVATTTADGVAWLAASPSTGAASTQNPGQVTVTVNPAGLPTGVFSGTVNVAMNGVLRMVNITLVVTPSAFTEPAGIRAAGGCTPSRLALTQTGLVNNFAIPAGWPATLIVQLNDDCGSPVQNGSVVASFSNGDPPLSLRGDQQTSAYSATWQPGAVLPQMTITMRATAGSFPQTTAQFIGAVNQNAFTAPTLVPNGALHIFFDAPMAAQLGGGLAPGNVSQVYGTGLASSALSPGVVPLVTEFNGTFMLIGGFEAPLFYISDGLLDVQVPAELAPNRQYSAIVSANGALTLPQTIDVVPLQPGLAIYRDGTNTVIAQRPADFSLIDATHPARPGEVLILYLAGMGATNPAVRSGLPAPGSEPFARVTAPPTVTVDGQNADIFYAGLAAGGVGLYQINFTVPANARTGVLDLVVTQGGVPANTAKLPVAR